MTLIVQDPNKDPTKQVQTSTSTAPKTTDTTTQTSQTTASPTTSPTSTGGTTTQTATAPTSSGSPVTATGKIAPATNTSPTDLIVSGQYNDMYGRGGMDPVGGEGFTQSNSPPAFQAPQPTPENWANPIPYWEGLLNNPNLSPQQRQLVQDYIRQERTFAQTNPERVGLTLRNLGTFNNSGAQPTPGTEPPPAGPPMSPYGTYPGAPEGISYTAGQLPTYDLDPYQQQQIGHYGVSPYQQFQYSQGGFNPYQADLPFRLPLQGLMRTSGIRTIIPSSIRPDGFLPSIPRRLKGYSRHG